MTKLAENLKIAVIGCGPHFRNKYFNTIQLLYQYGGEISLVIDLESEEYKIRNFFTQKSLIIPNFIFLPEKYRNKLNIKDIELIVISKKVELPNITHAIISTEPKAHKVYALWAINHNWAVFIDKPLTAFADHLSFGSLYEDYEEIESEVSKRGVLCVLSCQRRRHSGYLFLMNYLRELLQKYQVPLSVIDIHFAGGQLLMPDEFFRENHPYKYGYGVLLHSGYHYLDLLAQLLSLNNIIFPSNVTSMCLKVMSNNFYNILPTKQHFYKDFFHIMNFNDYLQEQNMKKYKNFGEYDIFAIGKVQEQEKTLVTFCIKLIEHSLSLRKNKKQNENPHLTGGRTRQENLILHVGHLCSIHVNSNPYTKLNSVLYPNEDFRIDIMNSPIVKDRERVIQITRKDLVNSSSNESSSLNEATKQAQLVDFLNGKDGNSPLKSHRNTIMLLSLIYKKLKKEL